MDSLTRLVSGVLLAASGPGQAEPIGHWASHIAEASARFGVPEPWIRSVIIAESGGRTMIGGRPATSGAGAMGLMQLMPGTWGEVSDALGLGSDPHDPRDNILAGTYYLRTMYDRFGYPGLFAAYNAGPHRYAQHLVSGRTLPAETRSYVAKVTRRPITAGPAIRRLSRAPAPGEPALFAVRRTLPTTGQARVGDGATSLFALRAAVD